MIYLSVVIPCYNEERNLQGGVLKSVNEFLNSKKYTWEVIVVDDGSTDKSIALVEKYIQDNPDFKLIKNIHSGKAAAVIKGMLSARGENILFTDMDQATPINQLDLLFPSLEERYDIAIGSRNTKRKGAPFLRSLMGPGFMILRSLILGLDGIKDTQCGFKLFKKEIARSVFSRLKLYRSSKETQGAHVTAGFDVEMLFLAKKLGYLIKEVPVEWHYVDTRRVSPIKDSIEGFVDLVKIRINDLRGMYG